MAVKSYMNGKKTTPKRLAAEMIFYDLEKVFGYWSEAYDELLFSKDANDERHVTLRYHLGRMNHLNGARIALYELKGALHE